MQVCVCARKEEEEDVNLYCRPSQRMAICKVLHMVCTVNIRNGRTPHSVENGGKKTKKSGGKC